MLPANSRNLINSFLPGCRFWASTSRSPATIAFTFRVASAASYSLTAAMILAASSASSAADLALSNAFCNALRVVAPFFITAACAGS